LVYIKTSNCQSNSVEVHIASAASSFKTKIKEVSTVFTPAETDGKWLMVPSNSDLPDLVFIKTANAHSNSVEVHVASGASEWKNFTLETGTVFSQEDNGVWEYYDWDGDGINDLIYLKDKNAQSGTTEVHVASGATRFANFELQTKTTFTQESTDGVWQIGPYSSRWAADLIFIKDATTTNGKTEVHIASQSSNYATRIQEVESTFTEEQNGYWSLVQFDKNSRNRVLDLVYIKVQNTGTNTVEVHIAAGGIS
jgi:hypothetical protein